MPIGMPAFIAASLADCMILQGFRVGIAIPGMGAETIWSSALSPSLFTPGEGGGGGGGGATVGGQAGGPAQRTSHWLMQAVTFEPASGPTSPTAGQPQPPVPGNSQGPHEALEPPFTSYETCMHLEPVAVPLPKHWDWLIEPVWSEHT